MALYKRYIPSKPAKSPDTPVLSSLPTQRRPVTSTPAPAKPAIATKQSDVARDATETESRPKRKRDRSEAEVAERKAKKLRKKGDAEASAESVLRSQREGAEHENGAVKRDVISQGRRQQRNGSAEEPSSAPSSAANPKAAVFEEHVSAPSAAYEIGNKVAVEQNGTTDVEEATPIGKFAHVRNKKKRHKLEKEARKAKKAAEKGVVQQGDGDVETWPEGMGRDGVSVDGGGKEIEASMVESAAIAENIVGMTRVERDAETAIDEVAVVKKERREKKRRPKHEEAEETATAEELEPAAHASEPQDDSASQPKKRRHKLESVLQQPNPEGQPQVDSADDHLRRHSNMLGKYQKATKHIQEASQQHTDTAEPAQSATETTTILHDPLAPLPQPQNASTPEFKPEYSSLPKWLAQPTVISAAEATSFADLRLPNTIVRHLSHLGFAQAMPVQSALIPVLLPPGTEGSVWLPGTEPVLPDLAVGAPTGSGKTLAYLLPILTALTQHGLGLGKLKAVVIVPTRELVAQVAAVAESLAKSVVVAHGERARIGTAAGGGGKLQEEREKLVSRSWKYDPEGYKTLMTKAHKLHYPPAEGSDSEELSLDDEDEHEHDATAQQALKDVLSPESLIDHVPTYFSNVGVLICTPGRLLEHLSTTAGFTLANLQYIVLDEADKLLDQQYDGFLEVLNGHLERERSATEQDARERYLRVKGVWDDRKEKRVRKVVCSATMTRDMGKLAELNLYRPKMVVVQSDQPAEEAANAQQALTGTGLPVEADGANMKQDGDVHEIPAGLREYMFPVGEGNERPLFLVKLLEEHVLDSASQGMPARNATKQSDEDGVDSGEEDEDEGEDTESEAEESSVLSDSSTDPSSSDDEDASSSSSVNDGNASDEDAVATMHPARAALLAAKAPPHARSDASVPTILIFTSSNESATRLSHLLRKLIPDWSPFINTLTKVSSSSRSSDLSHRKEHSTRPIITISTDRAARGLDDLQGRSITHVLQYDVPRSLAGYIHRVGRTARAGKSGEAWTLYSHAEAAWFMREVVRSKHVRRKEEVEKTKVDLSEAGKDALLRRRFEEVLGEMRQEVAGASRGRR